MMNVTSSAIEQNDPIFIRLEDGNETNVGVPYVNRPTSAKSLERNNFSVIFRNTCSELIALINR